MPDVQRLAHRQPRLNVLRPALCVGYHNTAMTDRNEKGHFLPGHSLAGPGRSTLYDPSMNDIARKLALLGLTDPEIASFFGVTVQTLHNWQHEHIAFFESLQSGKIIADAEVADSLHRRAVGEVVFTERRVKNDNGEYEIVRLTQRVPADPGAAKLWLTNRQGRIWRDKQTHEHTGADGGPILTIDPTKCSTDTLREIRAAINADPSADER